MDNGPEFISKAVDEFSEAHSNATRSCMKNKKAAYDPTIEFDKGAKLEATSYDKTKKVQVLVDKVTVGGKSRNS